MRKSIFVILLLTGLHSAAQVNLSWTECFQGRQRGSFIGAKQEVALRWGIHYTALQFYGDSLQCLRSDSIAWIHNRYFKSYSKYISDFSRVSDSLTRRHGTNWFLRFNSELDSCWRQKFITSSEDSACYPFYSFDKFGSYTYCADTVTRGCINLNTLEFEKDKIVPPNNFLSMNKYNPLYFPLSSFVKILTPKKQKSTAYCHDFFMYNVNGKECKIPLFDSANSYYSEKNNGGLRVTGFLYKTLVVLVTQPKYLLGKEVIIINQHTRKILKRFWVAPVNTRKGIGMWDEVCGYEETTTIGRYNNKIIVNIDVHCDENSQQDALHIIDLENFEVKRFVH